MRKALSILIPTYNYNVLPLVKQLHDQGLASAITFEIKVYDDCSPNPPKENEDINLLSHSSYTKLPKNIGRSAIRNKLAREATNETLLFLDADTKVIRDNFLTTYIAAINNSTEIIYGGITYQENPPNTDEKLRWVYGMKREALAVSERQKQPHLRFLTLNFLINKSVFKKIKFNEDIPNLRHEDTLFALDSKENNIHVAHIDNPVVHLGLESSQVFLRKSIEAVDALLHMVDEGLIAPKDTALSEKGEAWSGKFMGWCSGVFYKMFKKSMEKNLLSNSPSMGLFDMYRLGYYLQQKNR